MASTDSQPVIAVQALTKVFKDFWLRDRARAVDGVTFTVQPGEIFGLLGPNGSGKSTTIKIVLGLLRQTSGRVAVFGKPPNDVATKNRIGYLPEESYLYPFLNARETLDYYAKLFQLDRRARQRRTDELLEMVGLTGVQYRAVREYSKGMQRRIGIAQALINDPELLILDEPTTGLDPIGTRQVKDLIIELGRRGKTIVLSSHLLSDVEDCVSRMVILYGGKIQEEGTCDSLLTSADRSILETDNLDDETIAMIDRLIRQRTGGAINRVSKPRQRLEDKFVSIVERAIAGKVATSGAMHGGATASFLRAEGDDAPPPEQGSELIEKLIAGDRHEQSRAVQQGAVETSERLAGAPQGPDSSLIGKLVQAEPAEPTPPAAPPMPIAEIDQGVIGSLLDEPAVPPTPLPQPKPNPEGGR